MNSNQIRVIDDGAGGVYNRSIISAADRISHAKKHAVMGSLYQIDFDAIRQINMPGLILGPWGKDFHKMTERVNIRSLTREYPCVLEAVSRKVWGI